MLIMFYTFNFVFKWVLEKVLPKNIISFLIKIISYVTKN